MPMKIVSVWNPKGGQGKGLIALNLASAAVSELELNPLILCRDPQGSAIPAHAKGNLPFEVKPTYPKGAVGYDLVIDDHVASDWEVPPAPTVIIPTKPVWTDYATFRDALTRLEKAGKRIIQVVTGGSLARRGERAMILVMRRAGAFEIRTSDVFSRTAEQHRTVFDPAVNRVCGVRERRQELIAILTAVLASPAAPPADERKDTHACNPPPRRIAAGVNERGRNQS